jgi:hypothetical protein
LADFEKGQTMPALQKMEAQWFPLYYPMGPKAFLDADGVPSGATGAVAELTKSISNWPLLFMGLRITNVYAMPSEPSSLDVEIYEASKRYVDDEQTVRIALSQQNITAEQTLQVQLTGKSGVYWAPFPVPFPMQGANDIAVTVTRVTPYPTIDDNPIVPTCFATILAAVARNTEQTVPAIRARGPYAA